MRRLTGKRGVDVVFEHVGGTTWEKLIPIAECARAHRLIEERAVFGKIVLLPE